MQLRPSALLLTCLLTCGSFWLGCGHEQTTSSPEQSSTLPTLTYEEANGQILYERYCTVCHGVRGAGDGFNAYNLQPVQPRNFTDAEAMEKFSDQELFTAISKGGRAMGRSAFMPAWGATLNDRQIRYLIRYLRTLPKGSLE